MGLKPLELPADHPSNNFREGTYEGDITIVNWPQNDYFLGNLIDVSEDEFQKNGETGKQLSHSLFYWLQTEAPRPDGGAGCRIEAARSIMGTEDGMAKYPYIRESRRIKGEFTVLEEHVGAENRMMVAGEKEGAKAASFYDSVGIGYYPIDLHPSTGGTITSTSITPLSNPAGCAAPRADEQPTPRE